MPAAYVGAAKALAGIASSAMNSGGSSGGGMGGSSGGYNSGANPFAGLAGGLASSLNPPQAQTSPGAYSPPSNIGEGYNYIPTGQPGADAQQCNCARPWLATAGLCARLHAWPGAGAGRCR